MNRLLALALMLGVLTTGGCSRSPSGEIERVLNACAKQADYVNSVDAPHDKKAAYLADKMQEIDTRGCPREFRIAFQQHINAWRAASVAFAQNTGGNLLMESVASGLTGDSSYLGTAQRNANEALGAINATYEQLSEIATAYGAQVPHSVIE